jgi:SPP1 gp7 family putative phage head morphogenesis protein
MSGTLAKIAAEPPESALAYMRARGFVLSPTFDWRDQWQEAHTMAFTVAKSTGFDILGDVYSACVKVIAEGRTFDQFKKDLIPLLQAKGWWGKAPALDPETGEVKTAQLGSPRRLRIIYDTNLRTAQAAGAWARIQENRETHPYLRYVVILDGRERPEHRAWHGTVLPVVHVWWKTHYPPNGWRCRCTVTQLSAEDMEYLGYALSERAPEVVMRPWKNKRTGETLLVPEGIDPGFAYNVGEAALTGHAARALMGKLDTLPPRIAAEAMAESARFVLPALQRDLSRWIEEKALALGSGEFVRNERRVIGALTAAQLDFLEERGALPGSGSISIGDADIRHMQRDVKPGKWAPRDLATLPELLANPRAILWDNQKPAFLYVDGDPAEGSPRVAVVTIDQTRRVSRANIVVNQLRTTSDQDWRDLRIPNRFTVITGSLK